MMNRRNFLKTSAAAAAAEAVFPVLGPCTRPEGQARPAGKSGVLKLSY